MSVPEQIPINQFIIAGGETTGVWTWNLQKESELVVTKQLASTGAVVPLVLGVDYSVNALDLDDDNGGTINFLAPQLPAVAGDVWTLSRKTAIDRSPDFATSGDFLAETINEQLDELTRISQDSSLASSTAVRKDPGVGDTLDPLIPQPVTERALKFRDTGGGNFEMVMSDNDPDQQTGDAAASAASALASEEAAAISALGADNSASAASGFASNAATSETNAATSETNAATSETNAATSETNAANSASGVALRFNFDDEITMVDPGASDLRFNNATLASVTQIAIDALSADAGTPDVSDFIASWDDSNNPGNKGVLFIRKSGTPATFVSFKINAALTDNTGWLQIPVTFVDSNGTFTDGDEMFVQFAPAGDSALSVTTKGDLQTFSTVPARLPVGSNGQALLADSAETTGLRWGSGTAGKNLVINGNFDIAQRGTSFTAIGANEYSLDRIQHVLSVTAARVDVIQSSDTPDGLSESSMKIDVNTIDATVGAADAILFDHNIEGFNTIPLGFGTSDAKTVTLSFHVKSSLTGIYCVALQNDAFSRTYTVEYTINSADTWEKKIITIAGDITGTWLKTNARGMRIRFTLMAGSDFQGTPNTWQANDNFATSNQVNFMATLTNEIFFSRIQLEIGSAATDFENRLFAEELYLCQRYYERFTPDSGDKYVGYGYCQATVIAPIGLEFRQDKRVVPTMTTSGTFSNFSVDHAATSSTCNQLPSYGAGIGRKNTTVVCIVASGLTVGRGARLSFSNDAVIEADAEF